MGVNAKFRLADHNNFSQLLGAMVCLNILPPPHSPTPPPPLPLPWREKGLRVDERKVYYGYYVQLCNTSCYTFRYCPSLYEGLKPCPLHKHIHIPSDVEFLTVLLEKAEHELSGM